MLAGVVVLAALFLVCLWATLRLAAARVLLALATAALLFGLLLPEMALRGVSPLAAGMPAAAVIAVAGSLLIGGWRKGLAAGAGAFAALLLASTLPLLLAPIVQITGLDQHFGPRPHLEVKLWYDPAYGLVDFAGLQLVAIVLASVGAVMDVAMVIASSVREAAEAVDRRTFASLFRAGVGAGRAVFGPMLVTMTLVFFGTELAPIVARASLPGDIWGTFRLLNHEAPAVSFLECATAALGLLLTVPVTSFLAAWLFSAPAPRGVPAAGRAPDPAPKRERTVWSVGMRIAAPAAILLLALALERGYIASYDRAPVSFDRARKLRQQEALARVVSVQHPVELPPAPDTPHNPVREAAGDRLFPCAAEVLSGENRGRPVAFVNREQPRPYVNVRLRRGALVLLGLTTADDGRVLEANVHLPPIRSRPLLWSAAAVMVFVVIGLGRYGLRAILMTLCMAVALGLCVVPLFAGGLAPPLVLLFAFALLCLALLVFWGVGWRSTLLASAGTLAGLTVGGALAFAATRLMEINGTASAVNRLLLQRSEFAAIDFPQLLAAGMALTVMGAALDVAASVTAGLTEFRNANPRASARETLRAGLRLNRDVAGTMVLTVLFAWLAMRLPVLLLMHRAPEAFDPRWIECYAMEVIRFASGAVALLLAGPFAALLASATPYRGRRPEASRAPSMERRALFFCCVLAAIGAGAWLARTRFAPGPARPEVAPLRGVSSAEEVRRLAARSALKGDWNRCILLLWKARELDHRDPMISRDLAYAYMARKWPELARETIRPVLPALRDDARTRYLCGVIAWWNGDRNAAKRELRRALEIDPSFEEAAHALSLMP